jgi:HK97 family phage prohead protease/HK97 family phage major capsid protein
MEKEHKMKITMPVTLTASDAESRIIAGRIVQWDAVGNTSAGQTKFLPNSIEFSNDTKLVLEHEQTKPIGKLMEWSEDETGITASFKIAKTTAGNDALEEAATGLRSDFSVGVQVNDWTNDKGVMAISASELVEVSLVTSGAIPGAEVQKVAAVDTPEVSEESQEVTQSNPEGEQVSDTTVPEASAAETVEAAKVEVKAATAPYISTTVRNPIVDKASYLEHSVRAKLGSEESRMFVAAAADTTDNAGLVPTRQLTEVINGISNADRPVIDSISRGALPDAGMTFEIPKITVAPTVAVASQGGTPSETDMNSAFVSVDVKKYIGQQTFSLELLDRSSPAFFAELVRQMEYAYAKATDEAVRVVLATAGTDGGNRSITDGGDVADFVSDAAVSIYENTLGFAQNIIVSPTQWGVLMGLVDTAKRPIFQQTINPQNAGGDLTATAVRGNLLGLNLRVSRTMTGTGDNTMIIVNPDSYTWYESPRLSLQTNLISSGQVQVGYYGYGAIATKLAAGAYRWMVA